MEFKTAYKRAYSVASQALLQCTSDDTCVSTTGWIDATNNTTNWNAFMAKFKVVKYCDGSTTILSGCWNVSGEKFNESSAPVDAMPGFIDSSGMAWVQGSSGGTLQITGDVFFDTNGFKGPDKFGKDRFRLAFYPVAGVYPGKPESVVPGPDYTSYSSAYCKYPPCYYTSWLTGAQ